MAQRFADAFDRDAIEDLLEEAADDQSRGFFAGQAARLGVKNQLFIHFAARRAVRAADVVALDLEAGNRIGPGIGRQQQVVVPLVAVGLYRLRIDLDHARADVVKVSADDLAYIAPGRSPTAARPAIPRRGRASSW